MSTGRGPLFVPIALVMVGAGWWLTTRGVGPGIDWLWIALLAGIGICPLILGGIDRLSVPFAAFLGVCAVASLARQMDYIPIKQEAPMLVLAAGIVLLVCRSLPLPPPRWMIADGRR